MTFIDGTVINVALPVLQEKLNASQAPAQWIVESYALTLSALILVGGALGDKYGRRRIFNIGVVSFIAASLVCRLVSDINQLIFARAAQGIGAALLVPGSLAIISATFDKKHRAKAIGTWSGFTAIAAGFGPVLGGWLVDNVSWRWIFYINLPLAAAVLAISFWRVPESKDDEAKGNLDWFGAFLATIGLGGIVYGLTESNNLGFGNPQVFVSLIVGALAIAAFIFVEDKRENPMMPLGLFKSKTFAGANLLTLFLYAALGGILFFLPFNLIQVQNYSATQAGAALVPFVLTMFLLSRFAGGLIDRFGAKLPLVVGPIIAGIGFALFSLAPTNSINYWRDFFPAIMVMSLGMAGSVAPLTTTVMGAVEERRAGIASGINNAVSRTASLLAIAVFGIVMLMTFNYYLDQKTNVLPAAAQTRLNEQRYKLASAELSKDFDEKTRRTAEQIVNESFVEGFRVVAYFAAGLAFLSAVCSWFLIEGKEIEKKK
ncbi:MAG: MFS transporter [Acidobacteriota bacterium]|nr:MFS transporter [Acidobacteriota bacterium]